uniref:SET domain-containing protein 4 n=1 Tax=Hydra vulgaris TaxID=6087 RepID=T2M431_HYDVU
MDYPRSPSKGRTWRKRKNARINKQIRIISYAGLFSWSLNNGLVLKAVTPKVFKKTGRGLKTTKSVSPGDLIIALPLNLLITFDTILENNDLNFIFRNHPSICQKYLFILFLLIEKKKGENSYFFHYLNTLPENFSTPSYISQDEMQLCPNFIQEETGLQNRQILNAIKHISCIHSLIANDLSCIDSEVKWAWNVINTRSVYFNAKHLKCFKNISSINVDFALAPVLDLLNHNDTANVVAGFNKSTKHYEVHTNDIYTPGSQLFINYGPHSNRKLFCEYGFVLPFNMNDTIPIPSDILYNHFNSTNGSIDILDFNKLYLATDGFSWVFEAVAHFKESNTPSQSDILSLSFYKNFNIKPCVGSCIIEGFKRKVLGLMIEEHRRCLRSLHCLTLPHQTSPIVVAKILIESEINLMLKIMKSLDTKCLLDFSL